MLLFIIASKEWVAMVWEVETKEADGVWAF